MHCNTNDTQVLLILQNYSFNPKTRNLCIATMWGKKLLFLKTHVSILKLGIYALQLDEAGKFVEGDPTSFNPKTRNLCIATGLQVV